jgi:putative addiction module killer protein
MNEVREYITAEGRTPFARWFNRLNVEAARKVVSARARMVLGNFSNAESVGAGVYEYKIDFGPGYRIYFGKEGNQIVILLGGGTKKRQQADIIKAQAFWKEYNKQKRQEG